MEAESWTTLSSSVASVLSLEGEDAAVGSSGGPQDPPTPTALANLWGTAPSPSPRQPCSYLLASRVTSARSRRTEQLNSSSRVKDTWGKVEPSARWDGCTGSRGWPRGCPSPLPWPVSGRQGSQHCRAGSDPAVPCTPASLGWCPAEREISPTAGRGREHRGLELGGSG